MYIKNTTSLGMRCWRYQQIFRVMRLTTLLLTLTILQVSARTLAQKVSLATKNAPLSSVIEQLRSQTGYDFMITTTLLKDSRPVTVIADHQDLKEVLEKIFKDQPLTFDIQDKAVVIARKEPSVFDKIKAAFTAIDVHGTVVDENGRPLPGVNVKLKDNSQATITGVNGDFTLKRVDDKAVVVFSYVGYQSREIPAVTEIGTIQLQLADSKLDEVQVVAYGQTSQRLTTGNITTVTAKDIEKSPVTNPLLALQGRVAGMTIISSGGNANSNVTVSIQGNNSMIRGSDPFYVIDGVPYSSEYITGLITLPGANKGGSPLSFINPDDIESISILKDADATAIYGSRAANGAILINTKKGRPGDMRVSLNLSQGYSEQSRWLKLMNTAQYLEMRKEAIRNDGGTVGDSDYDVNGFWENNLNDHNWQKELSGKKAAFSNYNLSINGGSNNTSYAIGGTYRRTGSINVGNFSDKTAALHFNIDSKSKDQRFQVQLTGNYSNDVNTLPYNDMPTYAILLPPNAPSPYNADGSLNWAPNINGSSTIQNPYASLLQTYRGLTTTLIGNMLLRYEITRGLQFKTSLGYNEVRADAIGKFPVESNLPELQPFSPSTTNFTNGKQKSWIVEPQLTYQRSGKLGTLNALLGGSIQQRQNNISQVSASGFLSNANMDDIGSATSIVPLNSGTVDYKYLGLFAQINYNYKDKYLINISGRRDGSSRFGANNKFHNFGAVGLGYIFTSENFFKEHLKWLSFGKIRTSYGTTGNDQIGDYSYLNLYRTTGGAIPYGGMPGLATSSTSNPDIQWEETTKFNLGLDLGFVSDRFLLSVNYFRNRSSNQVMFVRLPSFAGSNVLQNIPAVIQNKGLEFSLNSRNISGKIFNWTSNLNFYIPRNKLVRFDNISNSIYENIFIVGEQLNWRRVYEFAGVNPTTGAYQFRGADGKLTEKPNAVTDQHIVSLGQRFTAGMENTISYKNWQLSFLFRYVQQKGENTGISPVGAVPGMRGYNALSMVLDRWQYSGQQANYARFNANGELAGNLFDYYRNSDATVSNASFLSLENVSLAWNLPAALGKPLHINHAKLFLEGQNLLKITPYKGLDPETLSSISIPTLRTLTMGLQVNF